MAIKRNLLLWIGMALNLLVLAACATVSGPSAGAAEPTIEVQGGSFSLGRGSLYAILSATGYGKDDGVVFSFAAGPSFVPIACNPSGTCSVYGQAKDLFVETFTPIGETNPIKNGRTKALQAYVWDLDNLYNPEAPESDLAPDASDFANDGWTLGFDIYSEGCVVGIFTKPDKDGNPVEFFKGYKNVTVDGGIRYLFELNDTGAVVPVVVGYNASNDPIYGDIMGDFQYEDVASCEVN